MCLAIPGIIVDLDTENKQAIVDYRGLRKSASALLLPEAKCGDYVLVHAGFIIQLLSQDDGAELSELAAEVGLYV